MKRVVKKSSSKAETEENKLPEELGRVPDSIFGTFQTLEDFGYKFDENLVLRSTQDNGYFEYINQDHYEWLGDHVAAYVQNIMKTKYNLQELWLNEEELQNDKRVNIFCSPNFQFNPTTTTTTPTTPTTPTIPTTTTTTPTTTTSSSAALASKKLKVLVVIIQGTGLVRAGEWARSLNINKEGLYQGSMFHYLDYLLVNNPNSNRVDYQVVILNPNKNKSNHGEEIPNHSTSNQHVLFSFDNVISQSKADKLAIIAHSYGGINTLHLLNCRTEQLTNRLACVAFTDSAHKEKHWTNSSPAVKRILQHKSKNWVRSKKPLDAPCGTNAGCTCVSAGNPEHKLTSQSAMTSVFKYLESMVLTPSSTTASSSAAAATSSSSTRGSVGARSAGSSASAAAASSSSSLQKRQQLKK